MMLLAFMIAGNGCKESQFADEVRQIDSLLVIHQNTAETLRGVDTTGAIHTRSLFADKWKRITKAVDSVDDYELIRQSPYWEYITLYSAHDRSLRKLLARHNRLLEASNTNLIQLNTLRSAILKNQIPADSVAYFLHMESLPVVETNKEVMFYTPELIETHKRLDSLNLKADEAASYFEALLTRLQENE
jgi:hypothetical protein